MTAVGLGQQHSQAMGSGFESLSCQTILRCIPNIFRKPKINETIKDSDLWKFSALQDKTFRRKISILSPPPRFLFKKLFRSRNFSET